MITRKNRLVAWFTLSVLAIISLAPFYLLIVNSFKNRFEISINPLAFPDVWRIENYIKAWQATNLGQAFFNSLFLSLLTVALVIITVSPLAYVLANRRKETVWRIITVYLLVCNTIPVQLFIIPLFFIFSKFHLTDNLVALSFIYCVLFTPFATFLLRVYFMDISSSIHDAAAIDGANIRQIFTNIMLPLVAPGLITVAVIVFLWTWNDFLLAVTFLRDQTKLTVGIKFFTFQGRFSSNIGRQMGFAVMIMVPILAFFIGFQKKFVAGMTSGGVKG